MKDSTSTHEIIRLSYDVQKPSITFESNWWFLGGIVLVIVLYLIYKKAIRSRIANLVTSETSFEINTGLITFNKKIQRNYQNLYIANRIYIELITRKAAIPIDKEKDVLIEIYASWYALFKIIREEIKSLPGEILINNDKSNMLIDLTIDVLNKGLRPHLTEYQAEFIKWYEHAVKVDNENKSPREIQKKYPKFDELTKSMLEVNATLKQYCEQLKKIIDNK